MNTKEMSREQISALADGEITEEQLDLVLAALGKDAARDDWAMYHQIGDLLRSDDMAVTMSADFNARFSARLDAEPTILAPAACASHPRSTGIVNADESMLVSRNGNKPGAKRWAMPGMVAAAAMAAVAFIATPQLMVAVKGTPSATEGGTAIAGASHDQSGTAGSTAVMAASASGEVIMRDARIDDYLFAHQRFSPSLYNTAQYARSATFATDSTK